MERYTIYCTEEQARKALELGVPIEFEVECPVNLETLERSPYPDIKMGKDGEPILIIPTAEQTIGWLRTKGFKFVLSDEIDGNEGNNWWVAINDKLITQGCSDNKELAAIDAALDWLRNNNK